METPAAEDRSLESPGISLERRRLLWFPLAASAGLLISGAPILAQSLEGAREGGRSEGAFTPLTRDQFGERWKSLALELLPASALQDESYAAQLTGLIARVPIADLPRLENPRPRNGLAGGLSWQLVPCVMVEFQMDPGAVLRLHNHPPQVVVTLCAGGEVGYRHFEIEGEAPPCTEIDGQEFLVRETRAGILRAGRSTSLTRARDGAHGFTAGEDGARIIDFTLSLTDDIETFSYLELSESPVDPDRRVYGARWLGKR